MPETLNDDQSVQLVSKYQRERDRYQKMALAVQRRLQAELKLHMVRCVVTARSKDVDSFRKKLRDNANKLEYDRLKEEFAPDLIDLAGARIMLYEFERDVDRVVRLIEETFIIGDVARFKKDHGVGSTRNYQARHRVVTLRSNYTEDPEFDNLKDVLCEIQVVSLVKHIWNELEHDIRYKDPEGLGEPNEEQSAWLSVLWDSLQAAETAVGHLSRVTDQKRVGIQDAARRIEDAEGLRLALGQVVGRPIDGNVLQLFALLNSTEKLLSINALKQMSLADPNARDTGIRAAKAVGFDEIDDTEWIVTFLFGARGSDFVDLVSAWSGSSTRLKRLILKLHESAAAIEEPPLENADMGMELTVSGEEHSPEATEVADADAN